MNRLESCVTPEQTFRYGIHKPSYQVTNLRPQREPTSLGKNEDGSDVNNAQNFPESDVSVTSADWIYEIPNPFPFRGRTYINKRWADSNAQSPDRIRLPDPPEVSLSRILEKQQLDRTLIGKLPRPLQLALATTSTDSADLVALAMQSCTFIFEGETPIGLAFRKTATKKSVPIIRDHALFEAVANNPHLPDAYKIAMVIRPGAQGGSEIVGEWQEPDNHVYEYLRSNSYIAGGHYAANMAEDSIRYSIGNLSREDMRGLRHLYYQRLYVCLAAALGLTPPPRNRRLSEAELENLRRAIVDDPGNQASSPATLWGWNLGFDFAPSLYRLHASHQQIHQQYATIPDNIEAFTHGTEECCGTLPAYGCGDLIGDWVRQYRATCGRDFFADYRQAIFANKRMDDRRDLSASLIVYQDEHVLLFVPKAQTSQWELNLMTLPQPDKTVPGNIVECPTAVRDSLDTGIFLAQKALAGLGAKMVTSIEYPKRVNAQDIGAQPLLYALLPRLPESPGAFSEAQLRFINGHYPEDFAAACRRNLP